MAEIFISYTRDAHPDEELVSFFAKNLRGKGHEVFIDKEIHVGTEWPTITKQKLEVTDFFLVLLSAPSVRSEMVAEEVRTVYRRRQEQGVPIILPVRVAYDVELPYDLGAYLNRIQYILWKTDKDTELITNSLLAAIEQHRPFDNDLSLSQSEDQVVIADNVNEVSLDKKIAPPSPSVDYRLLTELVEPRGAMEPLSQFYVERDADDLVRSEILKRGRTICIKGGRQTGKSSLLARAEQHAKNNGHPIVYIPFDMLDESYASNIDTLLHYLADIVAKTLKCAVNPQKYWESSLPPKIKLTDFLRESILTTLDVPVIISMDGVDRLFHYPYRNDFFSLIRAWHDLRAHDEKFGMLNIILSYSTESFLSIDDVISPFNVGIRIELKDFIPAQLEELNRRYGGPIRSTTELDALSNLIGGHPYLACRALYELAIHDWSISNLENVSMSDDGPFADHLRWCRWYLHKSPELQFAFKQILAGNPCADEQLFYRLRSAGLVQGQDGRSAIPRCGLYKRYFSKYL